MANVKIEEGGIYQLRNGNIAVVVATGGDWYKRKPEMRNILWLVAGGGSIAYNKEHLSCAYYRPSAVERLLGEKDVKYLGNLGTLMLQVLHEQTKETT